MSAGSLRAIRNAVADLRRWWGQDRIRVPLAEGRLLRLAPGAVIRVRGHPAMVTAREVGQSASGATLSYRLESADGPSELRLRLDPAVRCLGLEWIQGPSQTPIAEDEVEAWDESRR